MANNSTTFLKDKSLFILIFILSIILEKVKSFDFLDLSKTFNGNLKEREFNDVSLCYWIKIDLSNIKQDIFQIDQISSKLNLYNYDNGNSTTFMNFSLYNFPEEIYRDCGITRFCGILRWDEISQNFLYQILMHRKTSNRLDNRTINLRMQLDQPRGINWIYFCQSYILKTSIPDNSIVNDNINSQGFIMKISSYINNPKFFNRMKVQIRKDFFHSGAEFNHLDFNLKIKNTKDFIRAKNIKIFYDIDNFDKIKFILTKSIFFSSFLSISQFNYRYASFGELIQNKNIDFNFDDKSTCLQPFEMNRISMLPEFDTNLEFEFPKIFNHLNYKFKNTISSNLYSNYLESEVVFNVTNYVKNFALKYQFFIDNISNGSFISYLRNDYSFNEDINDMLDSLFKIEGSLDQITKTTMIERIVNFHGEFVLTNSLGDNENKNSFLDQNNNVLMDSTKKYNHPFLNFEVRVPIDQLNSAKYLIFEIKDNQDKLLFWDFDLNYFNDLPIKSIQTPNPNIKVINENVFDQYQDFSFFQMGNQKTLVNCFWLNTRNYYTEKTGRYQNFTIGFDLSDVHTTPYKKVSLNMTFIILDEKLVNLKNYFYNNIKKIESNWDFLENLDPRLNSGEVKNNFFRKEWNHFCSFTNINDNFESTVFLNNQQLFKIQDKLTTEFSKLNSFSIRYNITSSKVFLGDFKLNLISLQDPVNFGNLYSSYKYNGMYNSYDNLFYYNFTSSFQDRSSVIKLNCLRSVESNEFTYIDKYLFFDSLEPDISQIFTEGYPKIERHDSKFLKFKLRFNPDFIFKLFFNNNSSAEFVFAFLQNFKLLTENAQNSFINNSTLLYNFLSGNLNLFFTENTIKIFLNDRLIILSRGDLLNEKVFIIDNADSLLSSDYQTISLQIYEKMFNICLFSQIFNFFDFYSITTYDSILTSDLSILYPLYSYSLINANNEENSGAVANIDSEISTKINNLENYNFQRSRIFFSTFYFDNSAFNFTSIFIKQDKSVCFESEIDYTFSDNEIINLKSESILNLNNSISMDIPYSLMNKDYFSQSTLIKNYTISQLQRSYVYGDFRNYKLITEYKFDEFADKSLNSLINKFSFYTYAFQFLEKYRSGIEINPLNFFRFSTRSYCNTKNNELNSLIANSASFINFEKLININLNSNTMNLKNLKWEEDQQNKSPYSTGQEKLIFTIENNFENEYKMVSEYQFDDNIDDLKNEFGGDLDFCNVLDNINLKINLIKNFKNKLSFYTLHFEYKNKTLIDSLQYNEYFFVDIRYVEGEMIPKNYDHIQDKTDVVNYLENSPVNKKTIIKIKIYLERFKYKSFSYHNTEENKTYFYYSLENLFQPLFFTTQKLLMTIKSFFKIEGEIDQITQINNMNKFQFKSITIEEYSPKFISICFHDVRNYHNDDYEIDILPAISGVIYKDDKKIDNDNIIPFYKYKREPIISLPTICQKEKLLLYSRTNYRYFEYPTIGVLYISVYETSLSFFVNPACLKVIKSINLHDKIMNKIVQSYNPDRLYLILQLEKLIRLNIDFEIVQDTKVTLQMFSERISFKSPYIIDDIKTNIRLNYIFVIFNKNQDFKLKLDYEISQNRKLNRIINIDNYYISLGNCKDKLNIIDPNTLLIKYSNQFYSTCLHAISYYNRPVGSFQLRLFNLENILEIKATQQERKIFNNIELSIKSFTQILTFNFIKYLKCSKKILILAKRGANLTNIDGSRSFNFDEEISDQNKKIFENKEIRNYNYQINIDKYINNTKDFLYLDPSNTTLFSLQVDYLLNFTFFENEISFEKVLDDLFKEKEYYDLNFIYSYVSCKICLTNNLCDYSNSNVLEFKIKNSTDNTTQPSNETNKTINETIHDANNQTEFNNTNPNNKSTTEKNSTDVNNNTNNTNLNHSIIEDLEKNSTNTQSNQTLVVNNFKNKTNIISSLSIINQILNGSANISTTPFNFFTSIKDIKVKINAIKSNAELLEKLDKNPNQPNQLLIKETININLILSQINCTISNEIISKDCKLTKELTQEKILKVINKTLNCSKIRDAISNDGFIDRKNYLLDPENFLNSVASIYMSSMNYDTFSDKSINMINDINKCLLEYGPEILDKINPNKESNNPKIEYKTISFERNFLKLISSTSSNLIDIAMNGNKKNVKNENYNTTAFNDLVIKKENLDIKKTIERNSLMFMKLNKDLLVENKQENSTNNITGTPNKNVTQIKLITENIVFYSKKAVSREIAPLEKNSQQTLRYLREPEFEFLSLNEIGLDVKISLPIYYLRNVYNRNITSYSFIFYNKYPLLNPNATNFNDKVISLKLIDHNLNEVPIFNLTTPIQFYIKRTQRMMNFKKCVFFNNKLNNWNTTGCKTEEIGDHIVCSCNHLTDFSIGKYNPISLLYDIENLFLDAWIINDFKVFSKLNFSNAYMVYIFSIILIVYALALRNAVKKDIRDENDPFVYQIEEEPKSCSNVEVLKKLAVLKEVADSNEENRKATALKILQFKIESSLSEKREIIINNGDFMDYQINPTQKSKSKSINLDKSIKREHGNQENKNKEASIFTNNKRNILPDKPKEKTFLKGFLDKIIKKKGDSLREQTCASNADIEYFDNVKEIELQNLPKIETNNEDLNKEESKEANEVMDIKNNEKSEVSVEKNPSNPIQLKLLIDGLKINISNQVVDHKNFLIQLYNEDNQDLKQEIEKFFSIEKKNAFKTEKAITKNGDLQNAIKRSSTRSENFDIEKANTNKFENDLNSTNCNLNAETNKTSFISSLSTMKNSFSANYNKNEDKINDDCFESSFEDPSFRKKSINKLLETTPSGLQGEDINAEDEIQVRIKNYKIVRYFHILKYIFVNNYRLLCLIFNSEMPFSKTNFLTLMVSRIIATLGVGTMLSLRINPDQNQSLNGYIYNNKKLAVSIATILLVEVIFSVVEGLMKKSKIYKNSSVEEKYKIRNKAKTTVIIAYIIILFMSLFFIINTIWITLLRAISKIDEDDTFILQFFLSLFMDFFVKEVFVLTAKAYIYFLLIETEEDKKWKNFMITILALTV